METSNRKSKAVYTIVEKAGGKSIWVRLGFAHVNHDGSFLLVQSAGGNRRIVIKRFREQRKLRLLVESEGINESEFERGMFLLTKALMYFERYGKMYMADEALFSDEKFFRGALAAGQ